MSDSTGGDFVISSSEEKSIRKICLASSALFNLSACVYGWTAPIGAALGCVASLTNDFSRSTSEELQEAIEEAFALTQKNTSSSSHLTILDELVHSEVSPENLHDLIKKPKHFRLTIALIQMPKRFWIVLKCIFVSVFLSILA